MSTLTDMQEQQLEDPTSFDERCDDACSFLSVFLNHTHQMALATLGSIQLLDTEQRKLEEGTKPDECAKLKQLSSVYQSNFCNFEEKRSALEWNLVLDLSIYFFGEDATRAAVSHLEGTRHARN